MAGELGRQYFDSPRTNPSESSPTAYSGAASSFSPTRHRPTYHRLTSGPSPDGGSYTIPEDDEGEDIANTIRRESAGDDAGLGIATGASPPTPRQERRVSIQSIPRVAVGSKMTSLPGVTTPGSSDPLISPPPNAQNFSVTSTAYDSGAYDTPDLGLGPRYHRSASSLGSYQQVHDQAEDEPLTKNIAPSIRSARSTRSKYNNDFAPSQGCPSARKFYQGSSNWLAISIYTLAIFSTVFSGVYLAIAIRAPRWGETIHSGGKLTASTASVLTTLFAKLIELSFVAVFVNFLGQVLSRRAISNSGRGITLAEMNMRSWIMQPGTVITHYETVRFAALTLLGAISLTAAIMAMLYTTAAQALVTPMLKFGDWQNAVMWGVVKTSFANPYYIADNCNTPIQKSDWDTEYSASVVGSTCLQIDHAAQGYHNYQQYMGIWANLVQAGNGTTDQKYRPQGVGLFLQNTTVNGTWVDVIDTKAQSAKFNRVINNVTLAMPHSGIFAAARDSRNKIMQPEELDNVGMYNIQAALPSPYVNVLCANINKSEITPIVYEAFPNVTHPLNSTADLPTAFTTKIDWSNFSTVKTALDDVFEWDDTWRPPVFYKYPVDFNTVLNQTGDWPRNSVYLLGKGGPDELTENDFFMCRIKAGTTPDCSTRYTATGTGGSMAAHCEDASDDMAYIRGNSSRALTTSSDWFNVASEAMNSLSLNNGVTDGDASNARLLTQFMLKKGELNPALPSPAEALAVMTSCTLLMAAVDSPFVEFWNYSETTLSPGQYQSFNASIQAQQYASGGMQQYQRLFYVVLFFVFATNVLVLVYFLVYHGLVTDFSEPPNLFTIAVNSPPNELLAGSCGGGPEGDQYRVNWKVECEDQHLYMAGDMPPQDSNGMPGFAALRRRSPHVHHDGAGDDEADAFEMGGRRGDREGGGRYSADTPRTLEATPPTPAPNDLEARPGSSHSGAAGSLHNRESAIGRMYSKLSKRKSFI